MSLYFHGVLGELNTFIFSNFRFQRVLRFAIVDAWISGILRDAAQLAAEKAVMWVKDVTNFLRFSYPNIPCLRINITLIFMSFSSDEFTHLKTDVSVGFRRPHLCPSKGHQHGVSIKSFINLGKTFFRISRLWHIAQTWFLARLFAYWSSFISQIRDFLYWMACIFIFDGVTVKTEHNMNNTTDLHGPCIIYTQVVIIAFLFLMAWQWKQSIPWTTQQICMAHALYTYR